MKEDDIRPEALLKKYLELSKQDAQLFFSGETRQNISCVACENDKLSSHAWIIAKKPINMESA